MLRSGWSLFSLCIWLQINHIDISWHVLKLCFIYMYVCWSCHSNNIHQWLQSCKHSLPSTICTKNASLLSAHHVNYSSAPVKRLLMKFVYIPTWTYRLFWDRLNLNKREEHSNLISSVFVMTSFYDIELRKNSIFSEKLIISIHLFRYFSVNFHRRSILTGWFTLSFIC